MGIHHQILYVDNALLVINKPAGLLSVPGRGEDKQDCLATRVQHLYTDARIVHRLDMATSGLMVMARDQENHRLLSIAFAQRQVTKRYLSRVAGCPAQATGEINLPLITDWPNRPRQKICHQQGKPSLTRWRLLHHELDKSSSYLELEPYTGRSHQLRVHLAAIGHPILGDALYAPPEHTLPYPRLMLQAIQLGFNHPITQQPLDFQIPPDF